MVVARQRGSAGANSVFDQGSSRRNSRRRRVLLSRSLILKLASMALGITPRCRERKKRRMDDKQLLGELVTWPRLAVRLETIGQAPLPLFAEGQHQKLVERQFLFVAISRHADGDF